MAQLVGADPKHKYQLEQQNELTLPTLLEIQS